MADVNLLWPPPQPPNPPLNLTQFPPLPSSSSPPSRFHFGPHSSSSSPWALPGKEASVNFSTAATEQETTNYSDGTCTKSSQPILQGSVDVTMQEATIVSALTIQEASQAYASDPRDPTSTSAIEASSSVVNKLPSPVHSARTSPPCAHLSSNPASYGQTKASLPPSAPSPIQAEHISPPSEAAFKPSQENVKNWAQKLESSSSRELRRVTMPSISPEGIPRVKIPDSVFHKGAELHRDFVLGVFTGKTPSFGHIQKVLSHIWGMGVKLEIHLRPASRSMLVRVPNAIIRQKIVEQEIWHIGNSLFYVAQWSSSLAIKPPTFSSIPLWAHVRGIPFDLYNQDGLSRVADLLGVPIEVDEFTRRMVNIDVAHLKVRADCTKPLPTSAEIERDDGEVVTLSISYPWTPPTCPCCRQLGHLETYCPNAKWAEKKKVPIEKINAKEKIHPQAKVSSDETQHDQVQPMETASGSPLPKVNQCSDHPPKVADISAQLDMASDSTDLALAEPTPVGIPPPLPTGLSIQTNPPPSDLLTFSNSISPKSQVTHIIGLPAHFSSRPPARKFPKKPSARPNLHILTPSLA